MKQIPNDVSPYKRTPEFNQDTVPTGLLKSHNTKAGTWGKITILDGQLLYRILQPEVEEITLDKNGYGVVEPEILHEVELIGSVRFFVEFYK